MIDWLLLGHSFKSKENKGEATLAGTKITQK